MSATLYAYPESAVVEAEVVAAGYTSNTTIYGSSDQSYNKTTTAEANMPGDTLISEVAQTSIPNYIIVEPLNQGWLLTRHANITNGTGKTAHQLQLTLIPYNDPTGTLYANSIG